MFFAALALWFGDCENALVNLQTHTDTPIWLVFLNSASAAFDQRNSAALQIRNQFARKLLNGDQVCRSGLSASARSRHSAPKSPNKHSMSVFIQTGNEIDCPGKASARPSGRRTKHPWPLGERLAAGRFAWLNLTNPRLLTMVKRKAKDISEGRERSFGCVGFRGFEREFVRLARSCGFALTCSRTFSHNDHVASADARKFRSKRSSW
jgi:hypothetical protein